MKMGIFFSPSAASAVPMVRIAPAIAPVDTILDMTVSCKQGGEYIIAGGQAKNSCTDRSSRYLARRGGILAFLTRGHRVAGWSGPPDRIQRPPLGDPKRQG